VQQNVDIRSSKNSRLQQTIEAAVRNPTKTPLRPTGWEPLRYTMQKQHSLLQYAKVEF